MNLFDGPGAKHFCNPAAPLSAGSVQPLIKLHASVPKTGKFLDEGTAAFAVHQASLLNSVERWTLYSLVNYRRASIWLPQRQLLGHR